MANELFVTVTIEPAFSSSPINITITPDEDTTAVTTFEIVQLPSVPTGFTVSTPLHGTATVEFLGTITNSYGVIKANGKLTYVPDADYYGEDSFSINIEGSFGSRSYPVSVDIVPVDDTPDFSVTLLADTANTIIISNYTNPEASNVVYSVAIGGEPSNGTVDIINASTGEVTYTPNPLFTGLDSFVYRVTPVGGISETGVINITVTN